MLAYCREMLTVRYTWIVLCTCCECFLFVAGFASDTCPNHVGQVWSARSQPADLGTTIIGTYLFLNATFPCSGFITSWTYQRTQESPRIFAGVWRQVDSFDYRYYYTLVGRTELHPSKIGVQNVVLGPAWRIRVQKGDFLGFHYSRDALKNNALSAVAMRSPPSPMSGVEQKHYRMLSVGYYDENFNVGQIHNFGTNDRTVMDMIPALKANIEYTNGLHTRATVPPGGFSRWHRATEISSDIKPAASNRKYNGGLRRSPFHNVHNEYRQYHDGPPPSYSHNVHKEYRQQVERTEQPMQQSPRVSVPGGVAAEPVTSVAAATSTQASSLEGENINISWVYFVITSVITVCVTLFLVWLVLLIQGWNRRRKETLDNPLDEKPLSDEFMSRVYRCLQENPFYCPGDSVRNIGHPVCGAEPSSFLHCQQTADALQTLQTDCHGYQTVNNPTTETQPPGQTLQSTSQSNADDRELTSPAYGDESDMYMHMENIYGTNKDTSDQLLHKCTYKQQPPRQNCVRDEKKDSCGSGPLPALPYPRELLCQPLNPATLPPLPPRKHVVPALPPVPADTPPVPRQASRKGRLSQPQSSDTVYSVPNKRKKNREC